MKNVIKKLFPEKLKRFLTGIIYGWHGDFATWHDAKTICSGYDSAEILNKIKASALKVKDGIAVYERDSFIFDKVQYSLPLLSSLMWIAAQNKGKLNVLDFGGSLGSSYYQNKKFLDSLSDVHWCIVEQESFVKTGKESFENEKLQFFHTVDDCIKSYNVDVVLLSSVLQYIEEPFKLLDLIKISGIKFIIIDRTPLIEGKDRITVQKVNPKIYKASYPCWFFNKEKFVAYFSSDYKIILEFDALDKSNIVSDFKGFLFEKVK
jgi:putative methyltransferase (TIGR04325 family)